LLCYYKHNDKYFVLSVVYALIQEHENDSFWQKLNQLNDTIILPSYIVGDFNEMRHPMDNVTPRPRGSGRARYRRGCSIETPTRLYLSYLTYL